VTDAPRRDENGEVIPPGCILYKHIKYDVSDFLGSCVRLYQDQTNTQDVPLKPATTPFVDETGDDYGLGAGEAENEPGSHAYMDIGRTLQELARSACVGVERSGYYTYGCNCDDVGDCHAEIYGDLDRQHLPYRQNRTEGTVPIEVLRLPRVGGKTITSTEVGIRKPMMTEILRTGLILKSNETATIQQGESTTLATGTRLRSCEGGRIRITQSALGPGNKEMIHVNTCLLTHEDHDADIKFNRQFRTESIYGETRGLHWTTHHARCG
jgi:hypothetical protein